MRANFLPILEPKSEALPYYLSLYVAEVGLFDFSQNSAYFDSHRDIFVLQSTASSIKTDSTVFRFAYQLVGDMCERIYLLKCF